MGVAGKGQTSKAQYHGGAQATFDLGLAAAEHHGRSGGVWRGRAPPEDETSSVDWQGALGPWDYPLFVETAPPTRRGGRLQFS